MKLIKSAHTIYKTQYHIVFTTKYRRKIFVKGVDSYLRLKLLEIRKYYPDWDYIEIGIDKDHIHLHIVIPPKYSVSNVVNIIKANTSREMREKFKFLEKVYWGGKGIWSVGYFVSTVGINEDIIKKYVELQGKEDTGQAELAL